MIVQITFQYWLTFNLTKNEVLEFYVEVHSRGQSLMNQNWGLDNVFLFNNQGGTWENYIYKVNSKITQEGFKDKKKSEKSLHYFHISGKYREKYQYQGVSML